MALALHQFSPHWQSPLAWQSLDWKTAWWFQIYFAVVNSMMNHTYIYIHIHIITHTYIYIYIQLYTHLILVIGVHSCYTLVLFIFFNKPRSSGVMNRLWYIISLELHFQLIYSDACLETTNQTRWSGWVPFDSAVCPKSLREWVMAMKNHIITLNPENSYVWEVKWSSEQVVFFHRSFALLKYPSISTEPSAEPCLATAVSCLWRPLGTEHDGPDEPSGRSEDGGFSDVHVWVCFCVGTYVYDLWLCMWSLSLSLSSPLLSLSLWHPSLYSIAYGWLWVMAGQDRQWLDWLTHRVTSSFTPRDLISQHRTLLRCCELQVQLGQHGPEHIPDRTSEYLPARVSDRLPDRMPDRMSEYIYESD